MALAREELTSGAIKGLTVCRECFTGGRCVGASLKTHCSKWLCCAQPSRAVYSSQQGRRTVLFTN
ncbi:unnamed protein product, partial [Staurois parvus]